jgi:hypothetical protein
MVDVKHVNHYGGKVVTVKVPLDQHEYASLVHMAEKDLRNPENQIRFLILQAAKRKSIRYINHAGETKPGAAAEQAGKKQA